MSLEQITELFRVMTIINLSLLTVSLVATLLFKGTILNIHKKLFGLEDARINEMIYALFGFYKIIVIVLNVVPYLALLIIQ